MLILIAGITGNIGVHCVRHALSQNHTVRGVGRSPSKLPADILSHLESFHTTSTYYDIPAIETACLAASVTGQQVEAVICAYSGLPELHLDGQLILLRAAERAGIKRYLAAGWNYDWRSLQFGVDEPIYDAAMAFHNIVEITSTIRPCHIFSGMLADVFFGAGGSGTGFVPELGGVWDGRDPDGKKVMEIWGTGDEKWQFTTEEDAGKWGVEVITSAGAEQGGFTSVCSWTCSMNDLQRTYEKVRGKKVEVKRLGTVEELEALAVKSKEGKSRREFWDWHRHWFHLFCVKGTWNMKILQNKEFSFVKASSLEEFLERNPDV